MPKNIYARGFWSNVYEVIYPLSSRRVDGFTQAHEVGGAMTGFTPRADGQPRAALADDRDDSDDDEPEAPETYIHPSLRGEAAAHPHAD